jgi:hypothetical protein
VKVEQDRKTFFTARTREVTCYSGK